MKVVWTEEAELDLLRLPSADALAILDAVEELAERNVGFVRVLADGEQRLYVRSWFATLVFDEDELVVIGVFARNVTGR